MRRHCTPATATAKFATEAPRTPRTPRTPRRAKLLFFLGVLGALGGSFCSFLVWRTRRSCAILGPCRPEPRHFVRGKLREGPVRAGPSLRSGRQPRQRPCMLRVACALALLIC